MSPCVAGSVPGPDASSSGGHLDGWDIRVVGDRFVYVANGQFEEYDDDGAAAAAGRDQPLSLELLFGLVALHVRLLGDKRIEQLRTRSEFVEITSAGIRESHVHDVQITKEAPNYRADG